jgi:hypothetical protein
MSCIRGYRSISAVSYEIISYRIHQGHRYTTMCGEHKHDDRIQHQHAGGPPHWLSLPLPPPHILRHRQSLHFYYPFATDI